jgi:uncharacterized protein
VIAEAGNGLARYHSKVRLLEALDRILRVGAELVYIDEALLGRTLASYAQHSDKSWGLVDCASFLMMRDHGITDAFTSDKHFEQAGFHCLLSL